MQRILKWEVPVDDKPHMIGRGPVALVAMKPHASGEHVVLVWTVERAPSPVQYDQPVEPVRPVRVFGTGHMVPNDYPHHVGSVVDDPFVWHVMGVYA